MTNPINEELDAPFTANFDVGDDIITGSGEEDLAFGVNIVLNSNHFWQVDNPDDGDYDDGLGITGSSYRRAQEFWVNNMIPAYLRGDINESYYWLGRVAHLLEDATSIPHMHNDAHPPTDDSVLEEYTGRNFTLFQNRFNWSGENFAGKQYNSENLPNMQNFNWREVEPTRPLDRQNIELFRLFWYVAQKTQYFASEDADGNTTYVNLSGITKPFSTSLWQGDGVTIINNSADLTDDDVGDTGPDVEKETNAMIPHSMKSVAGLYRLFWDAVQVDWKHNHHDIKNTGYTLLKGDITSNNKQIWNFSSAPSTDFWDETAIAEIDNNLSDGQEIIVSTSNSDFTDGRVYALDGDTNTVLWTFNDVNASHAPSVDDADGDGIKEVIVGSLDKFLYSINSKNGSLNWKYRISTHKRADSPHTATIADINNNGSKEIVFGEIGVDGTFNGRTVALRANGSLLWNSSTTAVQGFEESPAIADLNGDGFPEVIITAGDGVYVYNGTNGVELCRNHMANIYPAPVVADLDNDNDYELIIGTSKNTVSGEICSSGTCYSGINALDNNCNMVWNATVDYHVMAVPAIANLDNDANLEIVVATALTPDFSNKRNTSFNNGSVYVFDGVTGAMDWNPKFVAGAKIQSSPAIVDIDNDGILEILVGAYDGKLYVIDQNKINEWNYSFNSYLIANPAIGDIDGDRVAEIVVKHASHLGPNAKSKYGGKQGLFTNKTYRETFEERLEKIPKINQNKINRKTFDVLTKLNDEAEEEFIIKFKDNVKNLPNIEKRKEIKNKTIILAKGQVSDIRSLLTRNDIDYIEYNEKIKLNSDLIPFNINLTNAPNVWKKTNGNGVKIAIIDSGISQHDDLNIAGGVSFISENYSDNNGHGTAVAGIISSLLNNKGIIGVSPDAEIYAIKIFENSEGNLYNAIEAVGWAIDNKMDIISMSWGLSSYSKILEEVLFKAYENNILLIASSGNDGENKILYPAHYPQVIAVGAVDNNNSRASFSNYGNELELVAPGVNIYTTNQNNNYFLNVSGTSFATPHIVGVGALIKSYKPNLTNCYIREILRKSAIDLGKKGFDEEYGYGLGVIDLKVTDKLDLKNIDCFIKREIKNMTEEPEEIFLLAAEDSTLETIGGVNNKPTLSGVTNISVIEGSLVNINSSGQLMASDVDNNTLTVYYSSPLNASGFWQTDCSSSGNYTVLVEVSDGNLSDFQFASIQVNESCLPDQSKFYFINSSGQNVAWFGDAGNIVLKGMLEQNSNYQEQPNDLFAMEENGNVFMVIAQNGSMYIDGTLAENFAGTLTSPNGVNNLGIYGSDGNLVGLINTTGYITLKGTLTQNGNP
ncbi:S8 family serine peptidase [Candidatus Woesearchaeota archaeon]|nr:S8 family serine peptidase [Candidatus Woesearchaeota archaeon]